MTQIKQLTEKDFDAIFELSAFAFQFELDEAERKRREEEAARHEIYGYMVDEQLAGKVHIIPLSINIGGHSFNMGGISAVATWPEYRRRGIAKDLLQHSLRKMKENGQVISLLHPFLVGFYRKYGWELAYVQKKYTIPIEKLKRDWQTNGYVRRSATQSELNNLYQTFAQKYNGMLERDEKWWQQRVLADSAVQIAVVYAASGEPEGYIIYKVKENVLTVKDYAYTTQNGLRLIYEFIGNHDSMAKEVQLTVPENDVLPLHLADPMFSQSLEPYFMARIVDVHAFLKQYPFIGENESVMIDVTDDSMPENSGCYQLKVIQDVATVTKVKQGAKGDVQCSVQQLAQIFLSFKRAPELFENGLISGEKSAIQCLDRMIPNRQTYLGDFF